MIYIGHRGAAGLAPGNTLSSIQAALDSGVDMIEIDIAICKSGEVVLMHDDRVDKSTDGKGYVTELSFEELQKLRVGEYERIPTLIEAIELIDSRCPLNIEIKGAGSSREVARILLHEINDQGRKSDDFLVSSYNHSELALFHKLCPPVRISPIISCHPVALSALAEDIGAWSLNMKRENISREIVEDAHKRGIKVLVFTVNYPDELEKLQKINVDGVFTDNIYTLLKP